MIILSIIKKNLISSLRGEYIDFIISRFTFTIFTIAIATILYKLNNNQVSNSFLQATNGKDYLGFMIVGTALYGTTQGILLNVSRTLMTERREGTLESILLIPFSRLQYYCGNQLFQLSLTFLDIVIAIAVALMLDVSFQINHISVIAGFIQILTTLFGIALLTSLLMISLRDTFFIQNTIIPIILMIGGYIFPITVLPKPLRLLSEIIPLYKGVNLVRSGVLENFVFIPNKTYLFSLFPGFIAILLGFILLPYIERKAIENYLS